MIQILDLCLQKQFHGKELVLLNEYVRMLPDNYIKYINVAPVREVFDNIYVLYDKNNIDYDPLLFGVMELPEFAIATSDKIYDIYTTNPRFYILNGVLFFFIFIYDNTLLNWIKLFFNGFYLIYKGKEVIWAKNMLKSGD